MKPVEEEAKRTFGIELIQMSLEFAALHPTILPYVSNNVADVDGDVELPIYLFLDDKDNVTGHYTGIGTARDVAGRSFLLD
jgi:hypothetical protein